MAQADKIYFGEFRSWLNNFLKPKGLQSTFCGFKSVELTSKHAVDPATGQWKNVSYSQSKPQRWLFNIRMVSGTLVAKAATKGMAHIGFHSSGQGKKATFAVRILPVIENSTGQHQAADEMEVYVVFAYRDPLEAGGNADPTAFDPATGEMQHRVQGKDRKHQPYIFAGLLGVKDPDFEIVTKISGTAKTLKYKEVVGALAAAIRIDPEGGTPGQIPVYDLSKKTELERLTKDIEAAYKKAGPPVSKSATVTASDDEDDEDTGAFVDPADIEIPEHPDLFGIDPAVYRQINAALHSGKQHIMFYGPPGTGKTTLARWVADNLNGTKWTMITGSADWSSQDIIGGYQPIGSGEIQFFPGVLLRDYDCPLIIDELNRCDIDKVIGPLFTVLSGQETTLPYRLNVQDADSAQITILPEPKADPQDHEYAPGRAWRLIATINSIDKASLYQMSYALSRRFGWVYVDVPRDTVGFIREYFEKRADPAWTTPAPGSPCPLGKFWSAINKVREIGPAPIIDAIKAIKAMDKTADFFTDPTDDMRTALLDAIDMVLLPMLDGIIQRDADNLRDAAIDAFKLQGDEKERITERMNSVAV